MNTIVYAIANGVSYTTNEWICYSKIVRLNIIIPWRVLPLCILHAVYFMLLHKGLSLTQKHMYTLAGLCCSREDLLFVQESGIPLAFHYCMEGLDLFTQSVTKDSNFIPA